MKSLQESLFDDNIKKDLTIRDVCELNPTKTGRGIIAAGIPIGYFFSVDKLKKYPHPYDTTSNPEYNSLDYLIGVIVDQPMPSTSNIKTYDYKWKWCENLKKTLTKYVTRSWRSEWDKKIDIYLIEYPNDCFAVSIDFDCGAGSYEFLFKQKNS